MELKRKRIQIRKYNVAEYQKEAMRQLQPPENLTVSEWAEKYRMLDSKTSAMPGPWRNEKTPYLKEIMDEFINYDTEEIIFCKPSQVGGTEAMQNMLGYVIQQDPSPTLIVYPTDTLAESISKNRLEPMIRASKPLRKLYNENESSKLELQFEGMYLSLNGANSPSALASKAIKYLFLDEVDKYPGASKKEADPIRIAGKVYGYASKTYITKNGAAKKSIGKSALKSKNTKNNKNKKDNKKKLTKAQELALKKKKEAEQKKLQQQKIDAYNNKIKKKSKIGNFGETIVFSVSSSKILTPKDMKRTVSARWEQHKILGKAPKSEFVGQNAPETTMTVVLSAEHGVKPRSTLGKIEKAIKAGTVNWLVIGGKFVGGRKMYISSCSETWDEIWNKGELVKATVNLTFVEYT